jgi:hypothetical protein
MLIADNVEYVKFNFTIKKKINNERVSMLCAGEWV